MNPINPFTTVLKMDWPYYLPLLYIPYLLNAVFISKVHEGKVIRLLFTISQISYSLSFRDLIKSNPLILLLYFSSMSALFFNKGDLRIPKLKECLFLILFLVSTPQIVLAYNIDTEMNILSYIISTTAGVTIITMSQKTDITSRTYEPIPLHKRKLMALSMLVSIDDTDEGS